MRERGLTFRSVLLGLTGGTLICLFVPYSDLAMQNTPLVGNNLPMGVLMLLLAFAVLVNGPLSRFRPVMAFSGYELAVVLTLMLVMCSMPSTGLMRHLLPNLAAPWAYAVDYPDGRAVLERLHVARWIFPQFDGNTPAEWVGDPLARGFVDHWTDPDRTPYAAWIVPFISWGIFVGLLAWALLCMACLMFHQWRHHEHLAFPLLNIQLALVESPPPRRWFNRVLSTPSFWIAFSAVLLLHLWNGLAEYFPKNIVPISRGFDLTGVLNEPPWSYSPWMLRKATLYFSMVGIAFFLSGSVAFSLWFFFVFIQCVAMIQGTMTGDEQIAGIDEQRHGAALAIFLSLLWLARNHLKLVGSQMLRGVREGEDRGDFLSHRAAAWGLVIACAMLVAWMVAAGAGLLMAINLVVMLIVGFVLITRIIAETGILHGALPVSIMKPIEMAVVYLHARPSLDGLFLNSFAQTTFASYREVLPVYATHGMANLEQTQSSRRDIARDGRRLIGWIFVAVLIAYAVSFWSSLSVNYHHSVTLDITQSSPLDPWGIRDNPLYHTLGYPITFERQFPSTYSRAGYLGFGFGVTAILSVLRLTFTWWPLHPIGYLLYGTFPSSVMWFSIFVGWAAKQLVLWLGSATFYQRCKPIFIGVILGEVAAGGAWTAISIILHLCGVPYRSILVLPQ